MTKQKAKPHKFFKKKSQLISHRGEPEQKPGKKMGYQFPSIFRFITEKKKIIFFGLLLLSLYTLVSYATMRVYFHYKEREKVLVERQNVLAKIAYWKKVVTERSGYRDGYFQLAVLEYQLGQKANAKTYLAKAMQLDPNFAEGMKLEQVLSSKY